VVCAIIARKLLIAISLRRTFHSTAIDPFLRHYYIRGFGRRLRFGLIENPVELAGNRLFGFSFPAASRQE
jgi:hypothetical protein